ncbi:MAG: hypothetical protein ABW205_05885 [Burkholderiales bacterium]
MKRPAILLVMLGLALGPGYYAWTSFFSGGKVAEHRLGEKGARWTLPNGDVMRFSKGNAFEPVELALDPAMNPVGLVLVFEVVGDVRMEPVRGNEYHALLLADALPVVEKQVTIRRGTEQGPNQHRSELVATLDVPAAGKYDFVLEETASPELPLAGITLEVRRNVLRPDMDLVWAGVALLVAGVVGFFLATRGGAAR